jgi:hypothetical protein
MSAASGAVERISRYQTDEAQSVDAVQCPMRSDGLVHRMSDETLPHHFEYPSPAYTAAFGHPASCMSSFRTSPVKRSA